MSASWSQGATASAPPRRSVNPPPVCFNCSREGHFVVDCPEPSRLNSGSAFPLPPAQNHQQQSVHGPPTQSYPAGPPQGQYPPQASNQQSYAQPPPYAYSQTPQSQPYGAPPPNGQYGRPAYQPPPQHQYPQNETPHYGMAAYQQPLQAYGPPASNTYPPSANGYPQNQAEFIGNNGMGPVPNQPSTQWNNAPPLLTSVPNYQQPQRQMSQGFQRQPSITPSQQSHRQTPQQEPQNMSFQQTPQTSASSTNSVRPVNKAPSITARRDSKTSSRASTPYGRRESTAGVDPRSIRATADSVQSNGVPTPSKEDIESLPAEDDEEQQFNWDLKYIFKEPPKPESVALAQPLATTFDMTPVPQVDSRSTRSVSRYARNDNLKEFVRSIRSAPQWSYLQEDPAFSDVSLEGPLIPIEEVPAWIEKRQGILPIPKAETPVESKKRAWSEEQDDIDKQIAVEASEEDQDVTHPNKRQKNDDSAETDEHMVDGGEIEDEVPTLTPGTPVLGTPVLGRSGTPCVANVDDAWAPQPGEGAAALSKVDPVEAVLAALGVTGSPKPVDNSPLPPYVVPKEYQIEAPSNPSSEAQAANSLNEFLSPAELKAGNQQNMLQSGQHQGASEVKSPSSINHTTREQHPHETQARTQYRPSNNPPSERPFDGPPRSASWSNEPQHNGYGPPLNNSAQYLPTTDQPYQNGPPTPVINGNQQYGPSSATYPNSQYGPPQPNAPPANVQYGPPQHYNTAPPPSMQNSGGPQQFSNHPQYQTQGHPQHGHTQPQGGHYNVTSQPIHPQQSSPYGGNAPQNAQYDPPPYTNPQYSSAPQHIQQGPPQFMNGQQPPLQQGQLQYPSAPSQGLAQATPQYMNGPTHGPPQYAIGPPQGHSPVPPSYANDVQQHYGPPQYGNHANSQGSYDNPPQSHPQYPGGNLGQSTVHHGPPRQDSGYISARGSYSNGPGQSTNQMLPDILPPAQQSSPQKVRQEEQQQPDGGHLQSQEMVRVNSSESEPGTPLSPTSAEILGKLVRRPSVSKKAGSARQQDDGTPRKARRPQPVVAEAYSRRW